jgi:2-keto-4-pentenoate hydratase/2-oxohepta-3-ene-1,7-dioic acid hydratase in catechol pathway
VIFSKPPTTVIGPGDSIEHNKQITQQLDWEVELAVIIGTTARRVRREDALRHVFGYSVMIDVRPATIAAPGSGSSRRARTPTRHSAPASSRPTRSPTRRCSICGSR